MHASSDMMEDSGREETDAALVARARQGEVGPFEQLYRRHASRLLALCIRLHGDRDHAEDALQETFIHAWQQLGSYRGDAAFGTWLYRVAVNTTLGRMRSHGRHDRHLQAVTDEVYENFAGQGRDADLVMDLEQAIARLPDGARTVLVLHDIEGYGHQEIAEMTGIAEGTSKAQLHRARRLLRERMSK